MKISTFLKYVQLTSMFLLNSAKYFRMYKTSISLQFIRQQNILFFFLKFSLVVYGHPVRSVSTKGQKSTVILSEGSWEYVAHACSEFRKLILLVQTFVYIDLVVNFVINLKKKESDFLHTRAKLVLSYHPISVPCKKDVSLGEKRDFFSGYLIQRLFR